MKRLVVVDKSMQKVDAFDEVGFAGKCGIRV
jgi:hypothetical protein